MARFGIRCASESLLLSSEMEREAWNAIEKLMPVLTGDAAFAALLFSWKREVRLATAKETYAWRKAIDLIKESNLDEKIEPLGTEVHLLSLMKSRPIMLRMAGEIANSLAHSYDLRHKIAFVQIDSTEPS